jgi:hypothetical protein
MTSVVVRGFDYSCWKCRQDTICVVAVHAERSRQSDDWLWFEDKHALRFARDLLQQAGMTRLADSIKERFSKTAGGAYLSNGCQHCDAIQGDWPLGRAVSDYAQSGPLDELPVLATIEMPDAAWTDAAVQQNMSRCGYPLTWADMD